jgi:hypothetical protein
LNEPVHTGRTRLAVVALIAAGIAIAAVSPAFAHSDQGTMAAEARPGAQPLTVTARARVVFANDGHPAGEAAVTVTATGPGGAQAGPTTLNRADAGEYEADLALPTAGDWSLQFTSTNPTATGSATATVAAAAPPAEAPPTSQVRRASTSDDDGDSSGLGAPAFVIGGAVVVAALVGGLVVVRRRR